MTSKDAEALFLTVVPGPKRIGPEWAFLRASLMRADFSASLSRAARWATYNRLSPQDLTEEVYDQFKTELDHACCPEPDYREQMMRRALADLKAQGYAGPIPPLSPQRQRARQTQALSIPDELLQSMMRLAAFRTSNAKTAKKNMRILQRVYEHLRSATCVPTKMEDFWSNEALAALTAAGWFRGAMNWRGDATAIRYRGTHLKLGQMYFDCFDRNETMAIKLRGMVKSGPKRAGTINLKDQALLAALPEDAIDRILYALAAKITKFSGEPTLQGAKDARWAAATLVALFTASKPAGLKMLQFSGPMRTMPNGMSRHELSNCDNHSVSLEVGVTPERVELIDLYCEAFCRLAGHMPKNLFVRPDGSIADNSEYSNWVSGLGRELGFGLTPTVIKLAIVRRICLHADDFSYEMLAATLGISQARNAKSRYQTLVSRVIQHWRPLQSEEAK